MAFFDKIGKKIEGMVQDAQEKTTDFIEVNRLNGQIRSERDAIENLQKNIGIVMHKRFQAGEIVPDEILAELRDINARLEKIAGLEVKIEETKTVERDTKAGSGTAPQAADTGAAGQSPPVSAAPTEADIVNEQAGTPAQPAAAEPVTPPEQPRNRFCTNCGSPLAPGKLFCGNCGTRND